MGASTELLERLKGDIADQEQFINQLASTAQAEGRDLKAEEMEMVTRAKDRLTVLKAQVGPMGEAARIASESRQMLAEIDAQTASRRSPEASKPPVEYRSAGQYVVDYWQSQVGVPEAKERLHLFLRAAAHQTTADNLGIIPDPIVGPVLTFIDASRPIVTTIGPLAVPGGRFSRPRITQHTAVDEQTAEKTELVSQKMLITSVPVDMRTFGGYVNVSRQNIDWSVPQIMDIVIADLAAHYAERTERVTAADLAAQTAVVGTPITAASDAAAVNAAVWEAAGMVYAATGGRGRLILAVSPGMMGAIGPLFPAVNPTNAASTGFSAGAVFGAGGGPVGSISGITVVMSPWLADDTAILFSTAAVELYEQRIGALQVTEPSVLGVQVAYAGYFADAILEPAGVVHLTAVVP